MEREGRGNAAETKRSARQLRAGLLLWWLLVLLGILVAAAEPAHDEVVWSLDITPSPTAAHGGNMATSQDAATGSATPSASPTATVTVQPSVTPAATIAAQRSTTATLTPTPTTTITTTTATAARVPGPSWRIRSVDTMKLSRDTLRTQLSDAQIGAVVRLDAQLHLSHITADVYYDDPGYLARWVRAIRRTGLHVWFRAHWYSWENHRKQRGSMTPQQYVAATRAFLQQNIDLFQNGDVFDFCPEPENGAYWLHTYGNGWSWRNAQAKTAFNSFIRSGLYMAETTLANRGRAAVEMHVVSVNASIATRMLSKPTVEKLGLITLDLYPEGSTRTPAVAAKRLVQEIAMVHRRWYLPMLIGEHGYARDQVVDDQTQARVLTAELAAMAQLPYLVGLNYWVDAGGPGYGGYTNLYSKVGSDWKPRPAAAVLARTYGALTAHAR